MMPVFLLLAAVTAQAQGWQAVRGTCAIQQNGVTLGTANASWSFPADIWSFDPPDYPHRAQSTATYADFTLTCMVTVDGVTPAAPPFDTAFAPRYSPPALWYYPAGLLLRAGDGAGYRLLFSPLSRDIALYKENVGFLAACPAPIDAGKEHALAVTVAGNTITVTLDGEEVLTYHDTKAPARRGVAGFVATQARATFREVTITPLASARDTLAAHTAHLALREWHNGHWLFDGDEPIARIMLYDVTHTRNAPGDRNGPYRFFGLAEVKLRPGVEPALPFRLDWELPSPGGQKSAPRAVTKFEARKAPLGEALLAWEVADTTRRIVGRGTVAVRYDAHTDGYLYDVHSTLILAQPYERERIQFAIPCPYWTAGPASPATSPWKRKYRYGVFLDDAGLLCKTPINHHYYGGGTLKDGGFYGFFLNEDINPVFELSPVGLPVTVAQSNQGFDLRMQVTLPKDVLPIPAGKELTARYRVLSYPYEKAKALLDTAAFPADWYQTVKEITVPLNTGQALNRFGPASWAQATDPFDGWAWIGAGKANWARTVGYDDTDSLKLDGPKEIRARIGEHDLFGPLDQPAYVFRAMVKSEKVTGNGLRLSIEKDGRIVKSAAITGTSDWTPLAVTMEGPYPHANLIITLDGKGTVWIDNVEFVPAGQP